MSVMKEGEFLNEPRNPGSPRLAAFHNIVASINFEIFFPQNVFLRHWSDFFFFESDRMFAPSFAEISGDLVRRERSKSCCLLNFNRTGRMEYQEAAAIFLEETATGAEYSSQLRRGGPAEGWLFSMDRYGCTSDQGEWCIYCEKENDVAVIAVRNPDGREKFASVLRELHAASIGAVVREDSSAPFPFSRLTAEWRRGLIENYGRAR